MNRIVPQEELKVKQPVQEEYHEQDPVDMIDDQDQQLEAQREVETEDYLETEEVEQVERVEESFNSSGEEVEEPQGYQKKNFARLREEKERIKEENARIARENEDLRRKAIEYEQYINYMSRQQEVPQPVAQPQEKPAYSNLKPDELAEWHAVQGYTDNKFSQTQKELAQMRSQLEAMNLERRVLTQHPDWYQVCSHDNVAKLKAQYPEVAAALSTSQDQYAQAASTYSLIKRFGIEEGNRSSNEANKKFEQNKNRPRSAASVQGSSPSPISQANRYSDWDNMTEQQKAALARETRELARRA